MKTKYRVIHKSTLIDLEGEVNHFIGNGWQVTGGISIIEMHSGCATNKGFYQAMILPKEIKNGN